MCKPLGVALFCFFAVFAGLCQLPADLKWLHIVGQAYWEV
ncbi:MAG: hypothetical protein PSV17_07240 [Methylotenera sp.]|nr:hypothetical protein [Methylotenera sp.]MDI1309213.1 hypothetical protein [Methylotenera sp.]